MAILVKELQCATKQLHATHDFTFELAISPFSANARSDPTTAAAWSSSKIMPKMFDKQSHGLVRSHRLSCDLPLRSSTTQYSPSPLPPPPPPHARRSPSSLTHTIYWRGI